MAELPGPGADREVSLAEAGAPGPAAHVRKPSLAAALTDLLQESPYRPAEPLGILEPREMADVREDDQIGARDQRGDLRGEAGRARVDLAVQHEGRHAQVAQAGRKRRRLDNAAGVGAELLVDLLVDREATHEQPGPDL